MTLKYLMGRLALVLLGFFLFCSLELTLRLFWEPSATTTEQILLSSIDPFRRDGEQFVTRDSFRTALRDSQFSAQKSPDTLRVFCLGGSATFGYPYVEKFSWPAALQRALNSFYPERDIEVINLGGTSYGTSRVLGLLRGIVKYDPDLIVIYSGNNEFVEDSYRVQDKRLSKATGFINRLYLARALQSLLPFFQQEARPETIPVETGNSKQFFFSPTVDGTIYQPSAVQSQQVLLRYRENLEAIADLAKQEDIPLVFSTVASNLASWPPDADGEIPEDPSVRAQWQKMLTLAEQSSARGNRKEALVLYRAAIKLFADNAAANFAFGTLLFQEKNYAEALLYLTRARDLDPSPIRAKSAMNEIVQAVADQHRIPLVDIDERAKAFTPDGIPGDTLFIDYVHPTPLGNVYIARAIAEGLYNSIALTEPSTEYSDRFWASELSRSRISPPLDANAAFAWGQIYLRKGMLDKAEAMLRNAIAQGYSHPSVQYYLADTLSRKGQIQEAFDLLAESAKRHPEYREPLPLLARLAVRLSRPDIAIPIYRKVLQNKHPEADHFLSLGLQPAQ